MSPYQIPPVVPSKQQLPYTALLGRAELAAYVVEPGTTLRPDPHLENHVTRPAITPFLTAKQWRQTVLEHLGARQTFRTVVEQDPTDLRMDVRVLLYIDPGVQIEFSQTYVAQSYALLAHPNTGGAIAEYSGFGKATGQAPKNSNVADQGLTAMAIRAALNDLCAKIENDKRFLVPLAASPSKH